MLRIKSSLSFLSSQAVIYYCFPTEGGDVVAKTRLATEELYKMGRRDGGRRAAGRRASDKMLDRAAGIG